MDLIISLMAYAQGHYSLVLLMVFLLTFTKSCAVISLLIPGTSGLLLFGTLASASVGHFLLMWMSASLGAIGGFWLSWRLGIRYRHRLTHLRWLTAERLARSRVGAALEEVGYAGFVGCEYRPEAGTLEGLGWFAPWRKPL